MDNEIKPIKVTQRQKSVGKDLQDLFSALRTYVRTLCVKIVITTGRGCSRPRGSTNLANVVTHKVQRTA